MDKDRWVGIDQEQARAAIAFARIAERKSLMKEEFRAMK